MAGLSGDDGSEDVNDFLARIRELGDKRDREDDERTRKLEEEIKKGRQERAARRAERARSISPTKDSPASTAASQSVLPTATPLKPDMPPPQRSSATMASPPPQEPSKPGPPAQSTLSRSGTLSWQQRPGSRGTTPTVRSRPLSMVAIENSSLRSPSTTPEPSTLQEKEIVESEQGSATPVARRGASPVPKASLNSAAASMLANKDPNWFKQTADRGLGSAAFRRSEEPSESDQLSRSGSIRLHGLSRESTAEPEKSFSSFGSVRGRPQSMASPSPSFDAVRLDPSNSSEANLNRTPSMSPAQGRTSPERSDRPSSPTKGMGGFVQSARLKRTDSVQKRWSTQTPGGLSRGNSIVSNRGSRELGSMFTSPSAASDARESDSATGQTPVRDNDGFVKPARPETPQNTSKPALPQVSTSRPSSPTKDPKRWSPVKASWLENKINAPDSPKPLRNAVLTQPEWMQRLQKAKASRGSVDLGKDEDVPTKTSTGTSEPFVEEERPTPRPSSQATGTKRSIEVEPTADNLETPKSSSAAIIDEEEQGHEIDARQAQNNAPSPTVSEELSTASPAVKPKAPLTKPKPETPPKKDFRANLKSRPVESDKSSNNEPEFKKAFGNLKRAETKNYKAPDTLKENIMRGKTGLSVTEGPQQTKRVDEFKESILAKKKEFTTAPSKPVTRNPSQQSDKAVPEALAKRTGMLNRTKSISETTNAPYKTASTNLELKPSTSAPEKSSSPAAAVPAGLKNSALAARFNPNLAGILARGPSPHGGSGTKPPSQSQSSETSASTEESEKKGPELSHQTTARARGPKRKPPKSAQADSPSAPTSAPDTSVSREVQNVAQSDSLQDKMKSYNQIKAGLIGEAETIDALGIKASKVAGAKPVQRSSVVSSENLAQRQSLNVEKSKPPAPRSPSTRVASSAFSPNPSTSPVEPARSEPLATITSTSNKVNTPDRPAALARDSQNVAEKVESGPKPPSPSKARSPPTPGVKRISTFAKPETPVKSAASFRSSPAASPIQPSTESRSPPVPAKSAAARSISSSIGSSAVRTPRLDPDTPAKQAVEDFFGELPLPSKSRADIDTQTIINMTSRSQGKIKTLRKQIWELTPDGKRLPMPMQGEHILFENSMYLCTHVFGSAAGKHTTEAYLWIGDGVSPSSAEDAQLFARNAAKEAGASGRPVVLHQGKESSNFFEALGGIVIIRRGSSNDATATYMLCGRKHLSQIAFDEVDYHSSSLCSGFPFIVAATGGRLFLWKGRGSGADELGCARLIAMDLCLTGEVEEVDEGSESEFFWDAIRSKDRLSTGASQHWQLKAKKENFTTRLFAIDDARPRSAGLAAIQGIQAVWNRRPTATNSDDPSTSDIREISPYSQNDLAQDGVFVLDAYFEVYVILGWRATARLPAFRSALVFAQEYAILAASQEDRPFVPAAHVIFAGASAPYLKSAFRKWDDKRVTTQPVGSTGEAEMAPIHEALAAVTE